MLFRVSLIITVFLCFPVYAENLDWQEAPEDSIAANQTVNANGIAFVDTNGVARVSIGAYSPQPVVNGKRYKRDVQISGLTFRDYQGNETGGIGVMDGTRQSVLAFDYTNREALVMWTVDDSLNPSTGIMFNERLKPEEDIPGRSRQRIALQVESDIPSLVFLGKDGTPRIKIGLDSLDNPIIEVIGKDGKKRSLLE